MDTPGKKTLSSELKQNTFTVLKKTKKTFFIHIVIIYFKDGTARMCKLRTHSSSFL